MVKALSFTKREFDKGADCFYCLKQAEGILRFTSGMEIRSCTLCAVNKGKWKRNRRVKSQSLPIPEKTILWDNSLVELGEKAILPEVSA